MSESALRTAIVGEGVAGSSPVDQGAATTF
jgi:hypothetical protein